MLRGAAVLLVVVLHGADIPYLNGNGVQQWAEINKYLEPFRMPLLMFLSGLLLQRSLTKPLPLYLWGKWAGIAWPLLVFGTAYGLFVFEDGFSNPNFWRSGGDYLWFLSALLCCYLIALVLQPLARRRLIFAVFAAVIFVSMLALRDIFEPKLLGVNRLLHYGAYFFLGAACTHLLLRWARLHWSLVVVLAAAAVTLAYARVDEGALQSPVLIAVPTSVMGIAVILWLAPRMPSGRVLSFFAWVGRSSLAVYVVHFPVMILVNRLMQQLGADPLLNTITCTVVGLITAILAVALRPWLPWLFRFPGTTAIQHRLTPAASADVSASR